MDDLLAPSVCKKCIELQSSLDSSRRIDPDRPQNLTVIAERKRDQQDREKVANAMMLLNAHTAQCLNLAARLLNAL